MTVIEKYGIVNTDLVVKLKEKNEQLIIDLGLDVEIDNQRLDISTIFHELNEIIESINNKFELNNPVFEKDMLLIDIRKMYNDILIDLEKRNII